jgi:hypothetical protein
MFHMKHPVRAARVRDFFEFWRFLPLATMAQAREITGRKRRGEFFPFPQAEEGT